MVGVHMNRTEFTDADFAGIVSSGIQGVPDDLPPRWHLIGGELYYISHKCAAAPAPGVDLSYCDLEWRSFAGADLAGANLRGAYLDGVDLAGANLTGAHFWWAHFDGANLTGANLTNATLGGATFVGANLSDVNFTDANLPSADLTNANLTGSLISYTTMTDDDLPGTNFQGVTITPDDPGNPNPELVSGWLDGTPINLPPNWAMWGGYLVTIPEMPTGATATVVPHGPSVPNQGSVTVSWNAPGNNAIAPATTYTVTSVPASAGCVATGGSTSCVVHGLAYGTSYTFSVTATNVAGTGASSNPSNAVIPLTVPAAPTGVSATVGATLGTASVTWTDGYDGGTSVTGYHVLAYDETSGGSSTSIHCAASPCSLSGLTPGHTYDFKVTATNSVGTGAASSPKSLTIVLPSVPAAPTGVVAAAVTPLGSASLSWTDGSDGGSSVTGYDVIPFNVTTSSTEGMQSCATHACTLVGLTPGDRYTFQVRADNNYGNGQLSQPSVAIDLPTVPLAPTGVSATVSGPSSVSLSWTDGSDGGSAVTGYTVTATDTTNPGTSSPTCTSSPCSITGLDSGDSYTFSVEASNAYGTGPSTTSSSVLVATIPDTPTGVSATVSDPSSVSLSWTDGTDGPVTGYTVTATDTTNPGTSSPTCTSSPCSITGLTSGDTYTFSVVADGPAGSSGAGSSSPVLVATTPDTPAAVTAANVGGTDILSWTDGTDGPITGYVVQAFDVTTGMNDTATVSCPAGSSGGCDVVVDNPGDQYTFTVQAVGPAGSSMTSTASNQISG